MRAPTKDSAYACLKEKNIPVRTVLDVGIHYGTPELMQAYPKAKHVLFEPVEEFREKIEKHYRNYDFELHTVAVGDATGEVTLKTFKKTGSGEITHSAMRSESPTSDAERVVPRITLDDFVSRHAPEGPFLLKIDVDGAESSVLKGAQETLKKCSIVIVECAGNSITERLGLVQAAGFQLFDLVEPCYYDGSLWQCDAVLVRRDLHEQAFERITSTVNSALYQSFKG